ncbi:MAG: hypothetical protein ABIR24_04740 [Verrucomicrobiota bacterium]
MAIIVGGGIGWWASRNPHSRPEPTPQPPAPTVTIPDEVIPDPPAMTNVEVIPPAVAVSADTNAFEPAQWEEKLDEILGDADDDTDRKANQLLDMMPKVDLEAQIEIAGHVVNLINDKEFVARAAKYLTNAEVPEAVASVFMNDLYNRDDTVKLPLILEIAKNEMHTLRDEAKDLLELYIEEDYGTNWNQWEESMNKYLKEHAADESPIPAQP